MPKPMKPRMPGRKRKRLSPEQLQRLEKMQARALGPEKAMLARWESKHERVFNRLVSCLPKGLRAAIIVDLSVNRKMAIVWNLFRFSPKGSREHAITVKAMELLAERHPDIVVRRYAILALVSLGSVSSVPVLESIAVKDPDTLVRGWVADALKKLRAKAKQGR